jgi:transcriptional regulator with XRE-family HTH domain
MKIISPLQCRAGRAILNMTRHDLAELSSVSAGMIGTFETENGEPRLHNLEMLRLALESAGVEFLDNDGVRVRRDSIRTYEGKNIHRQLLDEIYHDLRDIGGEILIKGLTEKEWESADDKAFLTNHLDRLMKANVTERILISEEDNIFVAPKHWYRQIPNKYFALHTQWMFHNKIATVTWGDIEKLIIIESPSLYISEVRTFNCIWDNVAKGVD